ncbi:MAG: TRAM domain-containing protein, partial [Planctomycetota bacterium]
MLLKVVRVVFILLVGVVAWFVVKYLGRAEDGDLVRSTNLEALVSAVVAAAAAAALVGLDVLFRRQMLRGFVATVFGVILGIVVSGFLIALVGVFLWPILWPMLKETQDPVDNLMYILQAVVPLIILATCYLTVSVVLRTKDEFRFVIPYVDFAEQSRTTGGLVLDSSVLIDGRIVEVAEKLMLNDPIIVPHFVIDEMQKLADSGDKLVRARGRRGLDMVGRLQASPRLRVRIHETDVAGADAVDAKLVLLSRALGGRLVTNDFNLAKVAQIEEVAVVSINDLAGSLRAPYLPGETLSLKIVRRGEEKGQGVGYLDDGTMVVVEGAREDVGSEVSILVTSSIQTSAGRMIFGRKAAAPDEPAEGGGGGEEA